MLPPEKHGEYILNRENFVTQPKEPKRKALASATEADIRGRRRMMTGRRAHARWLAARLTNPLHCPALGSEVANLVWAGGRPRKGKCYHIDGRTSTCTFR